MGKKERKRYQDPLISEIEEREKIKESVLKVFRERYSSPSSSGAIIIGKQNPEKSFKPVTIHEIHNSSSSMTDSDASSTEKTSHKKRRRRKRQKPHKKSKKVESTDRVDVAKHLKVANEIRQAIKPVTDVSRVSMITSNRLTRRMGLFNAGKKSSTISREIYVPDSVKRKTQEDLKKILHNSDKSDGDDPPPAPMANSPLVLPKPSHGISSKKSDHGYKSAGSNCITPASANVQMNVSSTSCISTVSSVTEDVSDLLPEEAPMDEISQLLIKNLSLKQFFPGRNLFEETVEELRKIMKQNSFSTTPMSKKMEAKKVDSVKRSLMDRYSPEKENVKVCNTNRPPSTTLPLTEYSRHSTPNQDLKQKFLAESNKGLITRTSKSPRLSQDKVKSVSVTLSQEKYMDGRELLKCNSVVTQRKKDYISTVSQNIQRFKTNELVDGKTLLKCNDRMIAEACHQMEQLSSKPQPMETDSGSDNALKLLEQNDKKQFRLYRPSQEDTVRDIQRDILSMLPDDIDLMQSSQSSGYQGSQNSRYGHDEHLSSRRRVEQYPDNHRTVESMPRFHQQPSCIYDQGHNKENVCEKMDILDYLDGPTDIDPPQKYLHTNHHPVVSSDDSYQIRVPSNVHVLLLPKKPTFESPSPEKLRPRFMH